MLIPTQQRGLSPEELPGIGFTYGLLGEQARQRRVAYRDISELELVGPVVTVSYVELPGVGIVDNSDLGGNPSNTIQTLAKVGQSFLLPDAAKILSVRIWAWRNNVPTGNVTFEIRNDNADHVGPTLLSSVISVPVGNFPSSYSTPTDVLITTSELAGGKYWLLIGKTVADTGLDAMSYPGPVASSYPFGGSVIGLPDGSDPTSAEFPTDISFVVTYEVFANVVVLDLVPSGIEFPALELTDANTGILTLTASGIELVERVITDADTVSLLFTPSALEVREATDATTTALLFTTSAVEAVQFVDAATDYLTLTPSGVELKAKEFTEAVTVPLLFTPSVLEAKEIIDAATIPLLFTPTAVEFRGIVDAVTVPLLFTPVAAEVREIPDAATVPFLFTTNAAEIATFADSNTPNVLFTPSGVETYVAASLTDAATGILTLTASAVEVIEKVYTDAAIANISLTPAGLESVIFTETATIPFKLSSSATEALTGVDQLIALVLLRPSGIEVYIPAVVYTDTATAILRFMVSGEEIFIPFIKPPQYEFEGIAYKQYMAICEEKVYVGIATNRYVAICEGTIYTATIPYQRWWTRYDTTYQGHHRAFAR